MQNGVGDRFSKYVFLIGIEDENKRLKRELEEARRKNYRLREQAIENERLRRMLNFKPREDIKSWIPAEVIARNMGGLNKTITIDKGSRDGVRPRMAVITYDSALVGQILDETGSGIGLGSSQVLLIIDRRSRVGVIDQRESSRAWGVVAGRPETDEAEWLYTNQQDDLKVGDLLISSGAGGVFLKGWPVGRVMDVTLDEATFRRKIRVKPVVDFSRLEEVMVIIPRQEAP